MALSDKYGGVPLWGWMGGGAAILLVGIWYVRRKNAAAAATAAQSSSSGSTGAGAATTPYGPASGSGIDAGTLAAILASQGAGSTATSSSPAGYTSVPTAAAAADFINAGTPVFYQVPGTNIFQQLKTPPPGQPGGWTDQAGNQIDANGSTTPLYVQTPATTSS